MKRLLPLIAALPMLGGATMPARSSVAVEVDGLRSSRGLVQACLTADAATFPDCQKDPAALHLTVPAKSGETVVFHDVMPGRYAIALFHDENANGRMDKMLMMPREGFGFSRDAPVRFGPPRFGAAAFTLGETQVRTAIKVRYIL
jgi:uncharacterized protein (DUF2141 family)